MILSVQKIRLLFTEAFKRFRKDEASRFGASLAYYSVFSLVPLLLILIMIAGFFLGNSQAEERVLADAGSYLGEEGREFLEETIRATSEQKRGTGITIVSILLVLMGAAAIFKELKEAFNRVFDAPETRGGLMGFLRKNALLFGMVLALGFLLLVSLALSALLSFFAEYFSEVFALPSFFWQSLHFLLSFAIISRLFALLYRFLPDVRLPWRAVMFGAMVTALLFTVGKSLIGFYLGRSDPASAFGAAGTVILILLWTYYSSQIILFGAELTAVHATHRGELAYRAEKVNPSSKHMPNASRKKGLFAKAATFVLFFLLRRFLKRLFRKF